MKTRYANVSRDVAGRAIRARWRSLGLALLGASALAGPAHAGQVQLGWAANMPFGFGVHGMPALVLDPSGNLDIDCTVGC